MLPTTRIRVVIPNSQNRPMPLISSMIDPPHSLLEPLDSPDPRQRNTAALQLRDFAKAAVAALFRAINRPENHDNRGSLLYALMPFNCSEHFAALFALAMGGNYEVQCHALSILQRQRFSPTFRELREASDSLRELKRSLAPEDHRQLLRKELREVLEREASVMRENLPPQLRDA